MIKYIRPSPFAEASLHFFIALVLSEEKPPWGAEPRFELGPALQHASALPTELRFTHSTGCGLHCKEIWIYVFPEKDLGGLSPNFPIHVRSTYFPAAE